MTKQHALLDALLGTGCVLNKTANSWILPAAAGLTSATAAGALTYAVHSDGDQRKRRNKTVLAALLGGTAGAGFGALAQHGIAKDATNAAVTPLETKYTLRDAAVSDALTRLLIDLEGSSLPVEDRTSFGNRISEINKQVASP
jgi:hypothetical protein